MLERSSVVAALTITLALFGSAVPGTPVFAQTTTSSDNVRAFPEGTKVGRLTMGVYPEAAIGSTAVRFAPGGRIFDRENHVAIPSTLTEPVIVRYHFDTLGQIDRAWILTEEEREVARHQR